MTNGGIIEGLLGGFPCVGNRQNNSDLSPTTSFFHVPVLDEVFAESRLGNPNEQVSVEKHKKHNRPMGHLKPSEGKDLVAWKSFCQSVPNTPMNVGEPWVTIGWAAKALLNRTPTYIVGYLCRLSGANIPNVSMRVFHGAGTNDEENAGRWTNIPDGDYLFGGSGASSLQAVSLRKPAIEKEARLRPQHFTFGSGDCSFANASEGFKGWGADEVAPPRS